MRIIVYVEGPSDRAGLEALLQSLMRTADQMGHLIRFVPIEGKTKGKKPLVTKGLIKAVNFLQNEQDAHVFLVPDLYPPNVGPPHSTCDELKLALRKAFQEECKSRNIDPGSLERRFHVHCFKYDFEVLLLASEERLKVYLKLQHLPVKWTKPVEDQDHNKPPKRVVEDLFREAKHNYEPTYDAPMILDGADPSQIAERCPQCFKPFIQELSTLVV